MLIIKIPDREHFDEANSRFITIEGKTIQLEHSLISVSRWESIWEKPFLSEENKTPEETLSYIQCMTVTHNVDPAQYLQLGKKEMAQIDEYIHRKMTATTITRRKPISSGRKILTSEEIYSQMVALGIPFECEKWHLARLLMLIEVNAIETGPKEKMPLREQLDMQRRLNEERLKKYNTRG